MFIESVDEIKILQDTSYHMTSCACHIAEIKCACKFDIYMHALHMFASGGVPICSKLVGCDGKCCR